MTKEKSGRLRPISDIQADNGTAGRMDDKAKPAAATNSDGSHPKQTAGQPSMNKSNRSLDPNQTIRGQRKIAADAYNERAAARKTVRQLTTSRNALVREYRNLDREAKRLKSEANAAAMKGDEITAETLNIEYSDVNQRRLSNIGYRSAKTRSINEAVEAIGALTVKRDRALNRVSAMRNRRAKAAAHREFSAVSASENSQNTPSTQSSENSQNTQDTGRLQTDVDDAADFPETITLRGGATMESNVPDDEAYDDAAENPDIQDASPASDEIMELADELLDTLVEDNDGYTAAMRDSYVDFLATTLDNANRAGIQITYQNRTMNVVDALLRGANPVWVWDIIRGSFRGGDEIEKFAYKGILEIG